MLDKIILDELYKKCDSGESIKIFLINGVKLKGHIIDCSEHTIVLPSTQEAKGNQAEILTYIPTQHIASIEM